MYPRRMPPADIQLIFLFFSFLAEQGETRVPTGARPRIPGVVPFGGGKKKRPRQKAMSTHRETFVWDQIFFENIVLQ